MSRAEFLTKVRPLLEKSGNIPPRTRELVDLTGIPPGKQGYTKANNKVWKSS